MRTLWWTLGSLLGLYVLGTVYLALVLRWEDERTRGLAYYGKGPDGRAAYRRWLRFHALLLAPLLRVNSQLAKVDFRRVRLRFRDVSLPMGSCDAASAERAAAYQPRPEDVFVVTQMKCGTTWMEHVVYQVVHRGAGDLVESGRTLYGVAPWLEGRRSVPIDQSQPVGTARATRIIKTHLPAHLCPWSPAARYIYVARHPVSCFASCMDFVTTNVGAMAPPLAAYEDWFRSGDLMWWGTWPAHVSGWWKRSREATNVLFLSFEEMKRDLPGVIRRVAEFLGVAALNDQELASAVEKCGFAYMQRHQDTFEMQPPHLLQASGALFVRGSADRHLDVPEAARQRMLAWAAAELAAGEPDVARFWPDVQAAVPSRSPAPPRDAH